MKGDDAARLESLVGPFRFYMPGLTDDLDIADPTT